jgi:ABC-type Fe3+-hydroxamate transport system substrate-binding protein
MYCLLTNEIGTGQLVQLQHGIPIIFENPANISRIAPIIHTLGLIVNNEAKTTDLTNWMDSYLNLVTSRLANLTSTQKPSVYIEYNLDWSAFGPEHTVGQLMSTAGGINIITNSSLSSITVSPEYVIEPILTTFSK